jgi:farnesyl-diphosphate farnesyltransferase
MASTNPREVAYLFRDYSRKIHAKASPQDPNFLRLSVACGKVSRPFCFIPNLSHYSHVQIEEWCERQYPTFVTIQTSSSGAPSALAFDPNDARTRVHQLAEKRDRERALEARLGGRLNAVVEAETSSMELMGYVGAAFLVVITFSLGIAYAAVKAAERWG